VKAEGGRKHKACQSLRRTGAASCRRHRRMPSSCGWRCLMFACVVSCLRAWVQVGV